MFGWNFGGSFHHFFEQLAKILQTRGRNDDGVAPAANVFGDAQKTAAWIFLERENKRLALNLDCVRLERVLVGRRFGCAVGTVVVVSVG